ncbi:hypothetical protein [Lichenicola sp.]|uniref:hypothetical protein n=1 Tax=Lichenicola sp. TaxID=2804529 RepID=UPI003B00403E
MSEDMGFIEGSYRLAGGEWQIVTAFKREGVTEAEIRDGLTWESGVTGMNVIFPVDATINGTVLLNMMSEHLAIETWREVRGPDSIVLR